MGPLPVTIVIPTYGRDNVLVNTIGLLMALERRAAEIVVIDQTIDHAPDAENSLRHWNETGEISWLHLKKPTIPGAMNAGLVSARFGITLFLDDDIVPFPDLVSAHEAAHRQGHRLVAGRVLQPWDKSTAASPSINQCSSLESYEIDEFIGCNFSVNTRDAIEVGGFDENFVRVAYNYEREFADRWREKGGDIQFVPQAAVRHLRVPSGGTRSFGNHLRTLMPAHSVGTYYYLLSSGRAKRRAQEFFRRPLRAIATRHHLRRPWWIPITLIAELTGMLWALTLRIRGPRYCGTRYKN